MWLPLIQCRAMRSQARKVESVKGDTYDPPFGLSSTRMAEKRVMDKAVMATTTINAPFFITPSPPISQLHTYNTPYIGMCQYPKSKIFWNFLLYPNIHNIVVVGVPMWVERPTWVFYFPNFFKIPSWQYISHAVLLYHQDTRRRNPLGKETISYPLFTSCKGICLIRVNPFFNFKVHVLQSPREFKQEVDTTSAME